MIERVGHNLFTPLNASQLQYIGFFNNRCISKSARNQTSEIMQLIEEVQTKCPFDDEEPITTTLSIILPESTTENLFYFKGEIENFVCELKDESSELKLESINTKNQLQDANLKIQNLENENESLKQEMIEKEINFDKFSEDLEKELQEIRNEILGITARPCTCK
ncbi:hypothetical protein PVAND_014647 [Polypedilum vanderplanki]|uniref:Uncharacterized protein n=1 Tax=Polypedilum vanderplanki TaxID=319348 RepID=A0A9J6BAC0_POLVA|nr:hypothetical protein PVAND_014647 [Polypedilum vanderplanki]